MVYKQNDQLNNVLRVLEETADTAGLTAVKLKE